MKKLLMEEILNFGIHSDIPIKEYESQEEFDHDVRHKGALITLDNYLDLAMKQYLSV